MTYIDKDKALNLDFRINVNLFESRRKAAERAVQAYADAISAIPEEAVRPVVRGEWLHTIMFPDDLTGHMYGECSNCGKLRIVDNFCPNCGADMREES